MDITTPFKSVVDYIEYSFTRNTVTSVILLILFIVGIVVLITLPTPVKVNGGWSEWETVKECTGCGTDSFKTEKRSCNNPSPSNMGENCKGENTRNTKCPSVNCPVDGGWSDWIKISDCSTNGQQNELRTCTNPAPQYGGQACTGSSVQTVSCNVSDVTSNWTDWTPTTKCSVDCGKGTREVTRKKGNETETKTIDCQEKECPINGGWSDYITNEKCSTKCGPGVKIMKRTCTNPSPQFGGTNCQGESEIKSQIPCNNGRCLMSKGECNALKNGPYPKECLGMWFKDSNCTNLDYIKNYPDTYNGTTGWWHSQNPEIVKQDMRNWVLNPFWNSEFKSLCMPPDYTPPVSIKVQPITDTF